MKPISALFLGLGVLVLAALFFLLKPGAPVIPSMPPIAASAPVMVSPEPSASTHNYEMVIKHGAKRSGPEVMQVSEGDEVTLKISSDQADELHVHGYDLYTKIVPGTPAVLSFQADRSGRFTMELHHSHVELGALEVLPR